MTALAIEMRAVRAHLEDLGSVTGRDGTIYECGRFSGVGSDWLVVVAQSGAGNHPAQSVVTYAHSEFQEFETLIFIGVGGSRKVDAPIGSVIAASHVYNPYSGKFGDDGFSARPREFEVDNRLVQVAYKVDRDGEWQERIRAPLKGVLPPTEKYPQPYPPSAFIAPIVSVEAVSANLESDLERHIARFCGDAYAVEMEGYGTVFAANRERTPCIIIRGVSDMASEKTAAVDAFRQPVAAVHAAAFGFELLSIWGQTVRPAPRPLTSAQGDENRSTLRESFDVYRTALLGGLESREAGMLKESLGLASQDLMAWPRYLPDGAWIYRPELDELVAIAESNECSTTVLLGLPGSGKSALLAKFSSMMAERGWPVLGIKADLLDPQVRNEADLGNRLDLTESPSILLERISALQPVLLVIDQLDALASYVDLRTGRLNVLLNFVRRLGKHPNVHIVLSARTFEFEHDVRLRSIDAESVTLELPAWHTILALLEAKAVHAAGWPADAQEVLRSPQALSTFLRLKDRTGPEPFRTYQAMLDRLWSERILQSPEGPRLARLVSDIAEIMAEEESLSLAAARFDDRAGDLLTLEGMGILTRFESLGSIGFSHQTLFDHALARSFARGKGKLSAYILSRETSLFIRPKLWAALTYLRDVERTTYEAELEVIWKTKDLRSHLRILLIDFMGQQSAPFDYEAVLLTPAIAQGADRPVAFRAITGSPGWFERLGKSLVAEAMTEDHQSAWLAVGVLDRAWSFAPDQVVALVRAHWSGAPAFDNHSWAVLDACLSWNSEVMSLAERILDRSDISPSRINYLVNRIGVAQPVLALRLVRAKFDRELREARTEAKRRLADRPRPEDEGSLEEQITWELAQAPKRPLTALLENGRDWDSLPALAEAATQSFLEILWPWCLQVFADLREFWGRRGGSNDFSIPYGVEFVDEEALGLPESSLLAGLRVAVERLAKADPVAFLAWVDANEMEDAAPVQKLIAHALATQPEQFAQRALKFLLDDNRRFVLGDLHDFQGTTERLIKEAAPFWPDEDLVQFEQAILAYTPLPRSELEDAKARQEFSKFVRRNRLNLLKALPSDRTSSRVRRLIAEETRVFPGEKTSEAFVGGWIGSPMETQAIGRASDDDVVNAFKSLPDSTGWSHPRDWKLGGNIQLSRAFSDFAKSEPDRAVCLLARFEPSFGERAAGYALDAMAEVASGQMIGDLFVDLAKRGFSGEEFRGSAARGIGRLVNRDISVSDEVVAVLEAWLENSDRLSSDDASATDDVADVDTTTAYPTDAAEKEARTKSVLWADSGFFIQPEGNYPVLETLMRILLGRPDHDRLARILKAHLLRPESPKVWQALLRLFIYLHPTHEAEKLEILAALFNRFPELTRSREAIRLLTHAQWWSLDFVRSIIGGWQSSEDQMLRQAFGELVALIAIVQPDSQWATEALDRICKDPELKDARVGVAFSAANLWNKPGHRAMSAQLLSTLIPQADARVWVAIFDLFRLVEELTPDQPTINLLQVISDHIRRAGYLEATFVVERLQTLLPHEAPIVGKIAQGLIANWRDESRVAWQGRGLEAAQLVDLAITLHRLGSATREMGTSLFEELLFIDAYSARQTLDEIDNRFKSHRRPAIPRLPRHSRRRG